MRHLGEIWRFACRVFKRAILHRIADESAQIAYFSFLALFPLILMLFALAGILGGEAAFEWAMLQLQSIMPIEAAEYLGRFVQDVTGSHRLDVLSVSLLFLLFAASSAVGSLVSGLNVIFGIAESRPWWRKNLLAVATTLLGAVFLLLGVSSALGGPALMRSLGLGWLLGRFPWLLVFAVLMSIVWLAYVFLPNYKRTPSRRALAAGAVAATGLWILVTEGFRLYLASFDRFATLYGFVTGILVLLIWLYLTAFAVLLGGEIAATLALGMKGER